MKERVGTQCNFDTKCELAEKQISRPTGSSRSPVGGAGRSAFNKLITCKIKIKTLEPFSVGKCVKVKGVEGGCLSNAVA